MKNFKVVVYIGIVTIAILCIGLSVYNSLNNPDFLNVSASSLLTLLVAVLFAFYFSQRLSDRRKLKDTVEKIIDQLQRIINAEEYYKITEDCARENLTLMQKTVSNKLSSLEKVAKKLKLENEVKYLIEQFGEYREFIGDHFDDLQYLSHSSKELRRYLSLMDIKLDEIKIGFYIDGFN